MICERSKSQEFEYGIFNIKNKKKVISQKEKL